MEELWEMLRRAGMEVRDFYGSLSGAPFTDESTRLVTLAVRS
jgi:hypothetical protein